MLIAQRLGNVPGLQLVAPVATPLVDPVLPATVPDGLRNRENDGGENGARQEPMQFAHTANKQLTAPSLQSPQGTPCGSVLEGS